MHKVAKKVANISPSSQPRNIYLADWLREVYPEVYEQYCAIKDIEESVTESDYLSDLRVKKLVELWEQFYKEKAE